MIATLAHPKVVPGDTRSVAQLDGAVSGPIESTAGVLGFRKSEGKTMVKPCRT